MKGEKGEMANYFDTGILLTAGFSLSSQAPLDGRSVVELLTDLDAHIAENRAYEGMEVYVKENKKIYIFNGTTWEEFVGSGSSEEQIKDWVSGSSYLEGDYIYHEGEIYRCLTSNSDVDFDEANWKKLTYGIDELSKEDVEGLLGLTKEEIEAMSDLILDTEVRIDKTYSSFKIEERIDEKVDEKLFEDKENKIIDVPESYTRCSDTDTGALKVVADGSLTDATTEVELSVVISFIDDITEGEYVLHTDEVSHIETETVSIYMPREETYNRQEINDKIVQATTGLENYNSTDWGNFYNGLTVTSNKVDIP